MSVATGPDGATAVGDDRSPEDATGVGRTQVATVSYVRSPRDLLRVTSYAAATLLVLGLTRIGEGAILGFEADVVEAASFLSSPAERVLAAVLGLSTFLAMLGAWGVPIATRRYRLFGYLALTNGVTALAFAAITWWLDRADRTVVVNELTVRAGLGADSIVSVLSLAQLAGTFTVLAPFVTWRWRRAGAIALPLMVLARIVVSVELPAELFVAVLLGATVGSAVLLAFGRPSRRPTGAAIRAALVDSGLSVVEVTEDAVAGRPVGHHDARLADGSDLFVKVVGQDERAADLLLRLYRFVRLRNVGDDRPFSSLRRTVEHEALVSLYARDVGICTPRLRSVVDVGSDSMLLAYDRVDGRPVDALAAEEVTDDLMRRTWVQVRELHRHRIAHRDLQRADVLVAGDGAVWLVGLDFSELAADARLRDADVGQLLASFAVAAGAERSVRCAVEELGTDRVGAALPRLQPMVLSAATRTAIGHRSGLLEALQAEVVRQCAVEEIRYERLDRVSGRTLFTVAMLAAVTYFLLPQFADLPEIVDRVSDASWTWLPAVLAASALSYLGAAVGVRGAVPDRLPAGPTVLTQVGTSFASTLAPAGLGGMAVNVRFLQKQGVDRAVAVSSIGLSTVAGGVAHLALLVAFAIWAGGDAFGGLELPDPEVFLLVALGLVAVGLVSLAVPATRAAVVRRLLPLARRSIGGVAGVLRSPSKVAQLLGGSLVVTSSYLLCTYFSIQAFGGGLDFATIGACYLLGSAVATAAPTPGGLGAMEAALIAALVAAGLDNAVAVPSVFLFRFATFWVPILPGWLAFSYLRRAEYV